MLLARAQGANKVIIADISLTEKAHQAIDADIDIVYQKCDVTKWNDLQALVDDCKTNFGDVPDVFVAAAGVLEPVSNVHFVHTLHIRLIKSTSHSLTQTSGRIPSPWKQTVMPKWILTSIIR